jgi:hypothetical protein
MALLSFLLKKKPVVVASPPRSLRTSLETDKSIKTGGRYEPPIDLSVPADVDLSALWEEPTDASSLATILSGVAAGASVIALLLKLVGK